MPPKRKNNPNGFMHFSMEWKRKHGRFMNMSDATSAAGQVWNQMDSEQRGKYVARAKEENLKEKNKAGKLACTGTPLAVLAKQAADLENMERQMKRNIEMTVRNSVANDELELQPYYFIMVNYFTKTFTGNIYVPAELSVAKYSLKNGVEAKYHTFINPGVKPYGHEYDAQRHAEATHRLPLPPNAMGDSNLGRIYKDVLNFVRDPNTGTYPALYSNVENIPAVKSVLEYLNCDADESGAEGGDNLAVYSIQYLFYIIKEATCEKGELDKPKSIYITDAYFENDYYEYQPDISCDFHEKIDRGKFCTLSCVTRWGFMFSDYAGRDIAIAALPGRHAPQETKLAAIITPSTSRNTTTTFYDRRDAKPYSSSSASNFPDANSDYKLLHDGAGSSRERTDSTSTAGNRFGSERRSQSNPWDSRSQQGFQRDADDTTSTAGNRIGSERRSQSNPWDSRSQQGFQRDVLDASYFTMNDPRNYADKM